MSDCSPERLARIRAFVADASIDMDQAPNVDYARLLADPWEAGEPLSLQVQQRWANPVVVCWICGQYDLVADLFARDELHRFSIKRLTTWTGHLRTIGWSNVTASTRIDVAKPPDISDDVWAEALAWERDMVAAGARFDRQAWELDVNAYRAFLEARIQQRLCGIDYSKPVLQLCRDIRLTNSDNIDELDRAGSRTITDYLTASAE